jgi:anhydro-N-acetylmuramic acid kinase
VADFRSRDVAAGGQGAPLVPAFHAQVFSRPDAPRAVLNLGGIGNLTLLPAANEASGVVRGFDCGPGNALLDHWVQQQRGEPFDDGGRWAMRGRILPDLLAALLAEPFLRRPPPKSTGRDLFNPAWLATHLAGLGAAAPADVQATLAEFTALAAAGALLQEAPDTVELLVCGGGALNAHVMGRLMAHLPGVRVASTAEAGLPPLQVEAAAFAWLARACLLRQPGNRPEATGARGPRVLGAIYPA